MTRNGFDSYYLGVARAVFKRDTCTRRNVAALVVKGGKIIGTGYNDSAPGEPGCRLDGACPRGRLSYDEVPALSDYDRPGSPGFCIAIHAEVNALAPLSLRDTEGATVYVTDEPCAGCRKSMADAKVHRVVWPDGQLVGPEIVTWNTTTEDRN